MSPSTADAQATVPAVIPPLLLCGVRSYPSRLFRLRGYFAGRIATLLLDSGASSEFIDPEFARHCGLTLAASTNTVQLADGTVVAARGRVTTECALAAAKGDPIPFTATFTATPLEGYDAILGASWLAEHDPVIGWKNRSISLRTAGSAAPRLIRPLECVDAAPRIASLSLKGFSKALRRREVEEVFAVLIRPTGEAERLAAEDPAALALFSEFADVFPDKLPPAQDIPKRGVEHAIELKPGSRPPPARPLHHQSAKDAAVLDEYIREGIASGQLQASTSPYGSMALVVKKKDGTPRVVIDYRALNEITVKNKYPLPLMDELFDRVHGAKFFSIIDLRSGFHQISIRPEDREKTAFRTRFGSYEYTVLPMGLCNAPGTFMQLMNDTFRDLLDRSVLAFLDDVLIFSRTREEHIQHVREVLLRLRKQKLYAKRSKCELFRSEVQFLGHRIGANGLAVSQDKVQAVREWPAPQNVGEVRSFLGLAGFYRRFVKDFSKIALPLTELTKETVPFAWGAAQQTAFSTLKNALCTAPVLLIPDPAKPYTLNCDACDYAIGATLQQDHGRGLQPVAFMSRKLTDAERNYDTREKEFMALHDACRHWRHYLHSELPFTLLSDHDSLKYHKSMPNLSGRLARWVERMAEFDYTIEHIAGVKNVVADALSRRSDLKGAWSNGPPQQLAAARVRPRPPRPPPVAIEAQRARDKAAAEESHPPAADRPPPNAAGAIVMPSQRCTASTKKGPQCCQRTAKGQYCWNHLRSISGLRIMRSSVPGAGLGLFASRPLPADKRIDYTGDRVPLESDTDGGAYFLQISKHRAIDAARTNAGEGRWVNDPRGTDSSANSEFSLYTPPGKPRVACVKTLRPIAKGEEILVKYGAQYWRYQRSPLRGRQQRGRMVAKRLATLSTAQFTSSLTDALIAAARNDEEYTARLATPPPAHVAHGGLLWNGTRLCVPNDRAVRTRIFAECHDSVTGAHFGRDKTLAAVKERFDWAGLATDVEQYVTTCDSCQRNKPSQQAPAGLLMPLPIPDAPCREWTQDAVTGLSKTRRGHDAIQVYVERLCKLKHFAAGRSTDGAKELAASFVHTVVRQHGVPESIVSDRDPRFTAHFYAELTKLLGITLKMSTAHHAQTDGQSEREIRTLITALRAFCNEHRDDWDDYLDMLELGFNSATQASTQQSPFTMLYGTAPRLPIDVALSPIAPKNPAAIDRARRMKEAVEFAREKLMGAQARQIRNADRHRREDGFVAGDMVMLSTEKLKLKDFNDKLCARFVGPFAVTAVVNANAYTLALPNQLQALHPTFNITRLKRYRDGRDAFPDRPVVFDRPPPEAEADTNGDAEWVVDRIVAKKGRGRGVRYLVAWKGYPPEEATWEPRSNLRGARLALADFDREQLVGASED